MWDGESMIFLGYSVSTLMGWCCVSRAGGKIHLYHCVWCFASVSAFSHENFGKNGFDCEQHGKAKRVRE